MVVLCRKGQANKIDLPHASLKSFPASDSQRPEEWNKMIRKWLWVGSQGHVWNPGEMGRSHSTERCRRSAYQEWFQGKSSACGQAVLETHYGTEGSLEGNSTQQILPFDESERHCKWSWSPIWKNIARSRNWLPGRGRIREIANRLGREQHDWQSN